MFMYNSFLVYCHELVPGTVSLTGDRAQGDDSKHDSTIACLLLIDNLIYMHRRVTYVAI